MELIPLLNDNGKEVVDNNGNIVLIGPDGEPKSQDELEPIILDNGLPLVNEENKPFLGLCGVPLINSEGNPVVGPGEYYDNDNKIVYGVLGIVAKDNKGNPIKIKINDNNKGSPNDKINNNNINIEEYENEEKEKENKKYNNIRPVIGPDGFPLKDSNNNYIMVDENNKQINNSAGISPLIDEQTGKPVLNKFGIPIIIDKNGE